MKVIKYKDPSIFLAVKWKFSLKYGYLKICFSQHLTNFKHVFPYKILCIGRNKFLKELCDVVTLVIMHKSKLAKFDYSPDRRL
jgi:hypothetical protein